MRRYIKDIITKTEICQWSNGDRILISAMTGTGKSQWVKDVLYETAKKSKKKILLLSNRNALKRQNENELGDEKSDVITLRNYQSVEMGILQGNDLSVLFEKYDYICFDECHYWFSDSSFNRNTDLLINTLRYPSGNCIFIYMTATPDVLKLYHNEFEFTYPSKEDKADFFDYSFIENLYFYNRNDTVESIITGIPQDEKVIYFTTALEAFEMSLKIPESSFICSDNNTEFGRKSSKATMREIEEDGAFKGRVLCTTTVLDTGISIVSPKVKHIIIDMLDPITFIQSLGRKRISEDERINLYVKNFHNGEIYFQLQLLNSRMRYVSERLNLGKEEFQKTYARKNFDSIVQNDMEINQAKLYQTKYLRSVLQTMIDDEDKLGYRKHICKILGIPHSKAKTAEEVFEKKDLQAILKEYDDRKLFKGYDQDEFKKIFFEKIFSPKRTINYRNRGLNSINSILQEDNIPFMVVSRISYEKTKRGRRYWQIIKLDNEVIQ